MISNTFARKLKNSLIKYMDQKNVNVNVFHDLHTIETAKANQLEPRQYLQLFE